VKLSGKPSTTRDRPVQGAIGVVVNCLETLTAEQRLFESGQAAAQKFLAALPDPNPAA